jgi:hypothetical protein
MATDDTPPVGHIRDCLSPDVIDPITQNLQEIFPQPPTIDTKEDLNNLTFDQAWEVMRAARRMLILTLLHQEAHEHMGDDCGDDLDAATTAWNDLYNLTEDGWASEAEYTKAVQEWLQSSQLYGVDGDIRYTILSDNLINSRS